ncbi:MAG: hypothetical protein H6Q89_5343, partial [Myxococcaceae bacterium]|nr:hypothetical protein [Myxococcaceae bacterium]
IPSQVSSRQAPRTKARPAPHPGPVGGSRGQQVPRLHTVPAGQLVPTHRGSVHWLALQTQMPGHSAPLQLRGRQVPPAAQRSTAAQTTPAQSSGVQTSLSQTSPAAHGPLVHEVAKHFPPLHSWPAGQTVLAHEPDLHCAAPVQT